MKRTTIRVLLAMALLWGAGTARAVEKMNIAVLDLDVSSGITRTYQPVLSDRLRSELFKTGAFSVVERKRMEELLEEQSLQLSGCTSDECAVEVGKVLGVQGMVAGSVGRVGKVHTVTVRLIDVETSAVLAAESVDCTCPIEEVLTTSLHNAAQKLAASLDTTVDISNPVTIRTVSSNPVADLHPARHGRPGRVDIRIKEGSWADKTFEWMEAAGLEAFGFRFGWSFVPVSSQGWYGSLGNGLFLQFGRIGGYRTQLEFGGGALTSASYQFELHDHTIATSSYSWSDAVIQLKLFRFAPAPRATRGFYTGAGVGVHTINRSFSDLNSDTIQPSGTWEGTSAQLGLNFFAGDLFDLHFTIGGRQLFTFAEANYAYMITTGAQPNGFLTVMTGLGLKLNTFNE